MTRAEHLKWCKRRATEYINVGDLDQAYTSMISDLGGHPETSNHSAIKLGMMLMMGDHLNTDVKMRDFIDGFN